MRKALSLLGSAIFLVLAPGVIAGYVPWLLGHWEMHPAFFDLGLLHLIGAALIVVGLIPLLESFLRFALEGLGTPAPIAPPKNLVIGGPYSHVRNPMYVSVIALIIAQALIFGDARLLWYAGFVWLAFAGFVFGYEEPTLKRKFEADYETFCRNVPRWIPRLTPWRG